MATDYEIISPTPWSDEDRAEPSRFRTLKDHYAPTSSYSLKARAPGLYADVSFGFASDLRLTASVLEFQGDAFDEFRAFLARLRRRHPGLLVQYEGGGEANSDFDI